MQASQPFLIGKYADALTPRISRGSPSELPGESG
jgi:hypothetical protein